jgi:mRNA interferase RelE/StbE
MHEIQFDKSSIDFLEKLPKKARKRIFRKIMDSKQNPTHFFERLEGSDLYKLRIGDYRVIADINNNLKIIKIVLIGHRRNVYKRM